MEYVERHSDGKACEGYLAGGCIWAFRRGVHVCVVWREDRFVTVYSGTLGNIVRRLGMEDGSCLRGWIRTYQEMPATQKTHASHLSARTPIKDQVQLLTPSVFTEI